MSSTKVTVSRKWLEPVPVVNGKKILQDVEGKMVYQGKFKTLAWDDVNGERITTAYHPNFHSFDLDYQKSKGKSVSKDDLDNSIVEINTGTVSFKKDSQMGKFLLDFTSFNGSNKARNPETKVLFENFDPIEETNIIMDIEQRKFDAMKFVMDAKNNEGRVFNLGAVFGLHNHNNDTSSIVSSLILKAKSETELFLKVIEEYKLSIDNMLKSAQSYEIIRFIDKKGQIEMLSESNQIQGNHTLRELLIRLKGIIERHDIRGDY